MDTVFPKLIIEGDSIILSKVTYHKQLATDLDKVRGGGWFDLNHDKKTITFRGSSEQFGTANVDDIREIVKTGKIYMNKYQTHTLEGYKYYYQDVNNVFEL